MTTKKVRWYIIKSTFFVGLFIILSSCGVPATESIQKEIDSIIVKNVPDTRMEICNISFKYTSKNEITLIGETTNSYVKQEIIKTLSKGDIVLTDSIMILPDTISNQNYYGLVTLSVINLRKQPDHKSELVSQAIMGTPVLILKSKNSWLQIQTPDNYIAWTERSSVVPMGKSEIKTWKNSDRVMFLDNTGWMYATSEKSDVVTDLVAGCIMKKTGETNLYIEVSLPDGRNGVVSRKSVKNFSDKEKLISIDSESVIQRASSMMGVPYLWGGTSAKGVDCSGFVQTVYFMNGLVLQRDASQQALHGIPIDLSLGFDQFRKGDLLFFGSREKNDLHITHVAIYKGNSEYIHASGRVMVNSLDSTHANFSSYRRRSLLAARRVIGTEGDPGIVPVSRHLWY